MDLVLHGATGYVGRLVAAHLAERAPSGVRVGLSGRSRRRLEEVRAELGARAGDWPLLIVDSSSEPDVAALAARTRVVATTVGPYLRYGLPLLQACAAAGTSYADLSGEVPFGRAAADLAHERAAANGARLVLSCGFDSVPSDLGVLLAAQRARADGAGGLAAVTLVLVSVRGGFSGGTLASMRGLAEAARRDPATRRLLADPYALSPDRSAEPAEDRDVLLPGYDRELGRWVAPFLMAPYNTRVVRRSNALSGYAYGRAFRYREVMAVGRGPLAPLYAAGVAAGLGGLAAVMLLPPARQVLDRVLPAPGSGPSERARREGFFRVEVHARTTTGARYVTTIAAQGDPGYAATAVLLGQSALSLAQDETRLPHSAGVLTPATGLGVGLADRLRACGFEITVAPFPRRGRRRWSG